MSRSTQRKSQPITDRKHVMEFGKFKGETIQEILDNDPLYLVWLVENVPEFDLHHELLEEAENNGKPDHEFKNFTSRCWDKL